MAEKKKRHRFLHAFSSTAKSKSGKEGSTAPVNSDQDTSDGANDLIKTASNATSSFDLKGNNSGGKDGNLPPQIAAIDIAPDQYWDQAYDRLKSREPKLIDHYEKILSLQLAKSYADNHQSPNDGEPEAQNIIAQNKEQREPQMKHLLDNTLKNIENHSKAKGNLNIAINVVLSSKSAVSTALNSIIPAALAWTGVCLALEVCSATFGIL